MRILWRSSLCEECTNSDDGSSDICYLEGLYADQLFIRSYYTHDAQAKHDQVERKTGDDYARS